jgi:cobalt-zinc-cadmium efflux system outer membrane protein
LEGDSLAREFLGKTQVRFDAGTVPRLDVLKAQVDLAQAENALLANRRDVANARAALNRLLGRPLGADFEAADSLAVPSDPPPLDSLVTLALARRPELLGLARQRAGAGAATALAQQYWLPDLGLSVEKNLSQGSPGTYTTGIGFSVPLFFWNHQRGEVAESKHHQRELEAAYMDLEAEVEEDVRTTYATAATALQQAVYLRDQLLPEARRAYQIALTSYGLGGSSTLDVLDARRTLLDAEGQYADALGAANDARADLERAIGTPLDADTAGARHDD